MLCAVVVLCGSVDSVPLELHRAKTCRHNNLPLSSVLRACGRAGGAKVAKSLPLIMRPGSEKAQCRPHTSCAVLLLAPPPTAQGNTPARHAPRHLVPPPRRLARPPHQHRRCLVLLRDRRRDRHRRQCGRLLQVRAPRESRLTSRRWLHPVSLTAHTAVSRRWLPRVPDTSRGRCGCAGLRGRSFTELTLLPREASPPPSTV